MKARWRQSRPFRTWLAWELGCLGEFIFWGYVVPFAAALLVLILFGGDVIVVSTWLYGAVILLLVAAPLVVLCTATFGYVRAKRRAMDHGLHTSTDAHDARRR